MKVERLITDLTAGESPVRETFWVILDVFLAIQAAFVVGDPVCDLEIPEIHS